ncbi:Hypothetical protein R9X50_00498200 [Acrodontium crateriforme]|uniref:Uncharacterized protein n=1 Tax=Acrodontium crateriforme TaxID=150365 RepID=A0AAQ3M574_9PEZI|nr:Hypothetical protein R9X50_00498200 [Acrodontium crateriforme]
MKGSAVVLGLKSFADKLHAQLPLSQRESSRLLAALTGSFRRHLDEVHPVKAHEDDKLKKTAASGLVANKHALLSSATLADRHLSDVLTNPLFNRQPGPRKSTKAERDLAQAKEDLENDPGKDPIALLEEYHQDERATVAIATLCLQAFDTSLKGLQTAKLRHKAFETVQPARRTLLWLFGQRIHETAEFANDSGQFKQLLTYLAMEEGLEEQLWALLKADVALSNVVFKKPNLSDEQKLAIQYSWKGSILSSMIRYKWLSPEYETLDDAIDLLLEAHKLQQNAPPNSHLRMFSMQRPVFSIYLAINNFAVGKGLLDMEKYDHCMDMVQFWSMNGPIDSFVDRCYKATLSLCHPIHPRSDPSLQLWRQAVPPKDPSSPPSTTSGPARFWYDIIKWPVGHEQRKRWHSSLMWLVYVLRKDGQQKDADWALSVAERVAPNLKPRHESYLKLIDTCIKRRQPGAKSDSRSPQTSPVVKTKVRHSTVESETRDTRNSGESVDAIRIIPWSMDLPR